MWTTIAVRSPPRAAAAAEGELGRAVTARTAPDHSGKEGALVAERLLNGRVRELLAAPHPGTGPWMDATSSLVDPIPAQMVSPEQAMVPARRLPSDGPGES